MSKYYTGIGSREAPEHILNYISVAASHMANNNFILRSGGASGSDSAFEFGCDKVNGKKEIYLPWKNFRIKEGRESSNSDIVFEEEDILYQEGLKSLNY